MVLFRGHVTRVDILPAIGAVAGKAGDDQIEHRLPAPEVVAKLQDLHGIGAPVLVQRRGVGDGGLPVQQQDVEVGCGAGGAADGPEGLRPLEHEETAPELGYRDADIDPRPRIEVVGRRRPEPVVERPLLFSESAARRTAARRSRPRRNTPCPLPPPGLRPVRRCRPGTSVRRGRSRHRRCLWRERPRDYGP